MRNLVDVKKFRGSFKKQVTQKRGGIENIKGKSGKKF